MNFNKNFRNERENIIKIKSSTYKITFALPAMCSSVSNLMPNQCIDTVLLFKVRCQNYLFVEKSRKIAEKPRECTSKITDISVVKCPTEPNLVFKLMRRHNMLNK